MKNVDLIIIDAKFMAHRFYGRNLMSEIDGELIETSIPDGFLTGLISFYTKHKPKYGFAICWDDTVDKLKRTQIYPEYKKSRKKQNEGFLFVCSCSFCLKKVYIVTLAVVSLVKQGFSVEQFRFMFGWNYM